jgi:hypothetical protein
VTLTGTGSDPDGDTLATYLWRQTNGPPVTLTGAGTAQASLWMPARAKPILQHGSQLGVQLAASAIDPDGDPLSYSRAGNYTSGGPVQVDGASSSTATFTPLGPGRMTFALTVSDGRGGYGSQAGTLRVNMPPGGSAGSDFVVQTNMTVKLVGTAWDQDHDNLTYGWTRTGGTGPAVILEDGTTLTPSFFATQAGSLEFTLTIRDGFGGVCSSSVTVVVKDRVANQPPSVCAGPSRAVLTGVRVALNATAIDPDQDVLRYTWTLRSGPASAVALESPSAAQTGFTPWADGAYVLGVTADDGLGCLTESTVILVAGGPRSNVPPEVGAGCSRRVAVGTVVTLTATAVDLEGNPISYVWYRDGGTGPAVTLTGSHTGRASFPATQPGTYTFTVRAADSFGSNWSSVAAPDSGTTYAWVQTAGLPVWLSSQCTSVVTFEAPDSRDGLEHLVAFELTVHDGWTRSEPAIVALRVLPPPAESFVLDLRNGLNLIALPVEPMVAGRPARLDDLLTFCGGGFGTEVGQARSVRCRLRRQAPTWSRRDWV